MTLPYTYLIHHIPTGCNYYGVRYAKNCHPSDLWTTYFTSSIYVKQLIDEYGKDTFVFQVRKIFEKQQDAISWEYKVLRRMKIRSKANWLNKCDGIDSYFAVGEKHHHYGKTRSEETKLKIKNGMMLRWQNEDYKNKQKETTKRVRSTQEYKDIISKAMTGLKRRRNGEYTIRTTPKKQNYKICTIAHNKKGVKQVRANQVSQYKKFGWVKI